MAKAKTTFHCQNCGQQAAKWVGKCPSCQEWNTFVEEVISTEKEVKKQSNSLSSSSSPIAVQDITQSLEDRFKSNDSELDRVLGGGVVNGSVVLIGGEPGIGKSTLLLQVALGLTTKKVLYISGEESINQIKLRADRIGIQNQQCYLLAETGTEKIGKHLKTEQPEFVIIDSIQTLHSPYIESTAGSISQIKQCTAELIKFAKETNTPIVLVGHINKDGAIAGPKVLEHMVDTVLQFEGDLHMAYRILRTTKNRFGSTFEIGIYEMQSSGLRQVPNPSEILLSQRNNQLSGIAIGATIEGNRPLLVEVQSLVGVATYGTPPRSSTGFDAKRLNMLLAVLEKRGGYRLGTQDVFLNIAGGLKIEDPAMDLAVCVSLISSYEESKLAPNYCFAAEIGLGGEVRPVSKIESRISEAAKLGFEKIFISANNLKNIDAMNKDIDVVPVTKLDEVLNSIL